MLKKRIIPVQLLAGGRLVKSVRFDAWRDVGDPVASSRVYNHQYADELVFLSVDRSERSIAPLLPLLERVSAVCFMPLALGGGIRTFDDAATLIAHGADKVVVTSAAVEDPALIRRIADAFGSQAVIAGIDVRRGADGTPEVWTDCGRRRAGIGFADHVAALAAAGAGELLVQSIDRDGTMEGYDVPLIGDAVRACHLPVIGLGGGGHYNHLRDAFLGSGCAALACGSLFNFGDNNPIRAKAFLTNHGLPFKVV